jgi:hypothetical protein
VYLKAIQHEASTTKEVARDTITRRENLGIWPLADGQAEQREVFCWMVDGTANKRTDWCGMHKSIIFCEVLKFLT